MYNYLCHCLRDTLTTRSVFIHFFKNWGANTSCKIINMIITYSHLYR